MEWERPLFIFRRDLRLEDNTGLLFALKQGKEVIPAFIFTKEQIEKNPYLSEHALKFMLESLQELDQALRKKGGKLYLFQGDPAKVVLDCINKLKVDALIVNRDYTPYSIKRDEKIKRVCAQKKIPFHALDDALLHPPEKTVKKDGKPYTVFTPYFKNATKQKVALPQKNSHKNYFSGSIPFAKPASFLSTLTPSVDNAFKGGRQEGLKHLKQLTHLSPYLKFTLISPREVYHHVGARHPLIRSLHWRDFFTSILFFFPHVFKGAFHLKYNKIKWSSNKAHYKKWCTGETGFPFVDAGMREMNETGFMPNRVRMVAASLLIKDLHIDWRWGEKYFAKTLIDYDPALNNGNWQWVASTGVDAQPYFRVFNPWTQQKKFDPDCAYIKKWIPELKKLPASIIHAWHDDKHHSLAPHYPPPIVHHEEEAKKAIKAYTT